MSNEAICIGVDLGGTSIRAGLVDQYGTVTRRLQEPAPVANVDRLVESLCRLVRRVAAEEPIESVGVAIAGFVDASRTEVLMAPNLDLRGVPLKRVLEDALGLPVVLENDSNAAAWGEFCYGVARGLDECLVVTVGTGVGGGLILDGQLRRGSTGIAGEIGHITAMRDGLACACGRHGCLEQYASGTALVRNTRRLISEGGPGPVALLERINGDSSALTGAVITWVAQQGDDFAREQLAVVGRWLGQGLADLVTALDVTTIVVGGGVAEAGPLFLEPAAAALNSSLVALGEGRVEVVLRQAILGVDAGIVGAAGLARSLAGRLISR